MPLFRGATYCMLAICFLSLTAELVTSAPSYSDYENIRDLYELLLQKDALENRMIGTPAQLAPVQPLHEIVRKSNRSPSLRLRFGRRADPMLAGAALVEHSPIEGHADNN